MQTAALISEDTRVLAPPFMAFTADAATKGMVMEAATRCGLDELAVTPVHEGVDDVLSALSTIRTPRILIVDLSKSENLLTDVSVLANVCDPECRVIIIGSVNDVNVYRAMMDQGVHEYLVKPITVDRISDGIKRIQRGPTVATESGKTVETATVSRARRVAFVGVHGGAGASTMAANYAWHLSEERKHRVSLIDLDLTFGTLALQLDTEAGKGLADALMTPSRVDELFLKRALIPYTDTLHLLASEADPGNMIDASADAIAVLFEHMKGLYDSVILDMPRDILVRQPIFLNILDEVLLVSEPSLVGLRDASRLARMIHQHNPDMPVRVVLNRIGLSSNADLAADVFAKNSAVEIVGAIPFDASASALAATKGRVMVDVDKRSKIAGAVRDLAGKLLPENNHTPSSRPFWSRLIQRG